MWGARVLASSPFPFVYLILLRERGRTLDPSNTACMQNRLHMSVLGFECRHAYVHVFPRSAGSVCPHHVTRTQ
jgi:hypothetical protein